MSTGLDRPFRTLRRLVELGRPPLLAVAPDATLADAARLLADHDRDAAVVIEAGTLRGIVSMKTFARAAMRRPGTAAVDLRVADLVDAAPAASLATSVPDALALLTHDADHVAVLDEDGLPVDLVSRAELLAELVWHHTEVIREMRLQERIMHLQGVYSC
ncbi:CBS domain-containing protein [Rhodoplanes roseus]|uniref:CBS domain-containing protein n=1 Tax=Rhodoplanes roseus TaxID=29409 RepID=A0A327KY13_9BRAD|nr:CBS domain-containing protein [Rhodoplanes roseus]RAI40298.1 hypothetical protein CH341_24035 [Rhodoplanes roseus]